MSERQYLADLLLRLRLSSHALKKFTENADATDLFFSRISFFLVLQLDIGFLSDCICAYTAQDRTGPAPRR